MKVVFVHTGMESLGIGYLSSVLKLKGHSVELVYAPMLFRSFRFDLSFLQKDVSSGAAREALRRRPDVVCFSVESDHFPWACQVAASLKKDAPDLPIVFGGIHPTCVPDEVMRDPCVDYVCVGEGEGTLPELLERIEAGRPPDGVEGVVYRDGGRVLRNPLRPLISDLDGLPFPDKDLFFDVFDAFVNGAYTIVTSRGCPNRCAYCHNSAQRRIFEGKGHYFRRRSVANVIAELKAAKARYAFKRISFCDDLFTSDLAWLEEFSQSYRTEIGLPFYCAVHPACIDRRRVELLEEAGCSVVNLGIQTLSETLRRDSLSRGGSNKQIVEAIEAFRESRIFLFTNFIFGLPGQDLAELESIVEFCARHRADFHDVNWLRYYPGTRIVDLALLSGILSDEMVARINAGSDFKPYAHGGHAFSSRRAQLRNLLFLSHFLPLRLVRLILRVGAYRLLPEFSLRTPVVVCRIFLKRLFFGKSQPYPNFSISDIARYYLHFIKRVPA